MKKAATTNQQRHNKALHPAAYSFGFPLVPRSKPALPAAGEFRLVPDIRRCPTVPFGAIETDDTLSRNDWLVRVRDLMVKLGDTFASDAD